VPTTDDFLAVELTLTFTGAASVFDMGVPALSDRFGGANASGVKAYRVFGLGSDLSGDG